MLALLLQVGASDPYLKVLQTMALFVIGSPKDCLIYEECGELVMAHVCFLTLVLMYGVGQLL